jgi:thiamine-monophosphate kinase
MGSCAVTVDSQIAGVHFPPDLDPAHLARRLLAVNLSDLAAMGARPWCAFLALSTPAGFDHRRFFRALLAACRRYSLDLAGGDLAKSLQIVASLTLLGRKPDDGRWLLRSAAVPGQALWLGGSVGESAAGQWLIARGALPDGKRIEVPAMSPRSRALAAAARRAIRRHLLPAPQLDLGVWLGRQAEGAALDVSDGLARDLHRLCAASSVGAEVIAEELPVARGFASLCAALAADPLGLALGGGEDYVLLFTLPPGVEPPAAFHCRRIGRITRNRQVVLRQSGVSRPLPPLGWDHLEKRKAPARTPGLDRRGGRRRAPGPLSGRDSADS